MTDAATAEELFRRDAYLRECEAIVTGVDENGVRLDRTVFYPCGGGQPGDRGQLLRGDDAFAIADAAYGESGDILHKLAPASAPTDDDDNGKDRRKPLSPGDRVIAHIDWERRHRLMRTHSCLHLLCAALPYPVTGGQVGELEGRLDFDIPEAGQDKDALSAKLNAMIAADLPIAPEWVEESVLDDNPDMVKTMAVKPPRGAGEVRLIRIEDCDLQACGGTHVRRTGEIGRARVVKIEKKGGRNRRVRIALSP